MGLGDQTFVLCVFFMNIYKKRAVNKHGRQWADGNFNALKEYVYLYIYMYCEFSFLYQSYSLQPSWLYCNFCLNTDLVFLCLTSDKGPLYWQGLSLITAWKSNYINHKVLDEITYPSPNFDGAIGVWGWIRNFAILHFTVITYLWWDWSLRQQYLEKNGRQFPI